MINVEYFTRSAWAEMSEKAHRLCFQETKLASLDRFDFAIMAVLEGPEGKPLGYVTCRELDAENLYWQYGGAFPGGAKDTALTWRGYVAMTEWCKARRYKRIATHIENTNSAMLKMAMKIGYRIVGVRNFQGSILLEHVLELQ